MRASDKASVETVLSVRRWTDALFSVKTTRGAEFRFVPGQFARLGLDAGSEVLWRAYSIVSAPHDKELEYYAVLVPQGTFSPLLERLRPGDPILTERASHGFMTVDRFAGPGKDLWMLATGTGLGPFLSILQDARVWGKYRRLVLVHGVRHSEEFAYSDLLTQLQGQPPVAAGATLSYIQSTTRDAPAADPQRLHGRITTLLGDGGLERRAGATLNAEDSHIMICGNPEMISETRRLLHERGLRPCRRALPGHFLTENYW